MRMFKVIMFLIAVFIGGNMTVYLPVPINLSGFAVIFLGILCLGGEK